MTVGVDDTLVIENNSALSVSIGQLDIESGARIRVGSSMHMVVQPLISKNDAAMASIVWSGDNLIASSRIDVIQGDLCLDLSGNPHGQGQLFYESLQAGRRITTRPANAANVTLQPLV